MAVNQGDSSPLGAAKSIYKAVVVDVVTVGASVSPAITAINSQKLSDAPMNTCVVKIYGASSAPPGGIVAYPFFPPHLQVPVKPGEIVWVVSPTLSEPSVDDCYWVCKITTTKFSQDVNFSHPFRNVTNVENSNQQKLTMRKQAADSGSPVNLGIPQNKPQFLNNLGPDKNVQSDLGPAIFTKVYSGSRASNFLTPEPIPFFHRRPGDLVLQGSNNAFLSLGQDRGYSVLEIDSMLVSGSSANVQTPKTGSGTVDIVAGLSRYLPPPDPEFYFIEDGEGGRSDVILPRTAIPTVLNTKGFVERDLSKFSPGQGDVDFAVDASRLYVSMQTDGDYNFGLLNTLTGSVARMPASIVSGSIQPASGSAYVIAKSDEIRIIARKQLEDEYYPNIGNPEINGSIKIIKEGTKDDDLAAVVLQPDGSIQISGSRIFLGRHPEDGGLEESEAGPEDATHVQPYVRYQQLEDLLNAIMDNIDAFCDTLNTHVTPGYGNPSPQILDAAATLKSDIASRREEIVSLKSSRIFGE